MRAIPGEIRRESNTVKNRPWVDHGKKDKEEEESPDIKMPKPRKDEGQNEGRGRTFSSFGHKWLRVKEFFLAMKRP